MRSLVGGALLLALVGCKPAPLPGEGTAGTTPTEVATAASANEEEVPLFQVGDVVVTLEALEQRLDLASFDARLRGETPAGRTDFMTSLIRIEIIAQAAEREGLTSSPFVSALETDTQARARLLYESRDGTTTDDLDPALLEAVLPTIWSRPELRRGRVFVSPTLEQAEAAREALVARLALELETPERAMQRWIAEHPTLPEVVAGEGDLGWLSEANQAANPELREALFAIEATGELSEPVHTARGWELVMWTESRVAREWDAEALRPYYAERALDRYHAQVQAAALERWRAEHLITRHEDAIATLEAARASGATPPVASEDPSIRPRRFSEDGLAFGREMLLGYARVAELESLDFNALHTPLAVVESAPPPVLPPSDVPGSDAHAPPSP